MHTNFNIFDDDQEDFVGSTMAALDLSLRLRNLPSLPPVFFQKNLLSSCFGFEHFLLEMIVGSPQHVFELRHSKINPNQRLFPDTVFGSTLYNNSMYIVTVMGQHTYGFNMVIQNDHLNIINGINGQVQSEHIFSETGIYYDQLIEHVYSHIIQQSGTHFIYVYQVNQLQAVPKYVITTVQKMYSELLANNQEAFWQQYQQLFKENTL